MPAADQESSLSSEREQIRGILTENIQHLNERIAGAWSDDMAPEAEKLQLQRLRTMGQLARQYRLLARDDDIDEMSTEVDTLWELVEDGDGQG